MKAGKKQSLSPNEKFSLLKLLSKNTKNLLKKKKTSFRRQTKNRFLTCELQKLQNNKWKNYIFQKKLNKQKVF